MPSFFLLWAGRDQMPRPELYILYFIVKFLRQIDALAH